MHKIKVPNCHVWPVLTEDEDKGHVWFHRRGMEVTKPERRTVYKLKVGDKEIHCEMHEADTSYKRRWLHRLQSNNQVDQHCKGNFPEGYDEDNVKWRTLEKFNAITHERDIVFMSWHYRNMLGVAPNDVINITLIKPSFWRGGKWAHVYRQGSEHPETLVRFSTYIARLAIIGIALGALGVLLASAPLWSPSSNPAYYWGVTGFSVGALGIILSSLPLSKRTLLFAVVVTAIAFFFLVYEAAAIS